jgi:GTP-binding protein EngB required for normal cell division
MNAELTSQLSSLAEIVPRFGLNSLRSTLEACESLSHEGLIDLAVLGQFKSGKSSFLNALIGEALFPVGVLPVTAVITRAAAGPERSIRVTHKDGSLEEAETGRLAEFVTEFGNPGNEKDVAVVDAFSPAMRDWPRLRLVDTPGLGSVFAHNTEATRNWMPNVAVALVTISTERPLADEDRRLIAEARQTAPRVIVVLTKVDLLTDAERKEVTQFLERTLRESFDATIPVLPFSCRAEPQRWVRQLREHVLEPVAANAAGERQAALALKMRNLASACQGYLTVALQVAERSENDRDRLRDAIFTESVSAALIHDELQLAKERVCAPARSAFTELFFSRRAEIEQRMRKALAAEQRTWQGNLAKQARRYEAWMAEQLAAELAPLSQDAIPLATELLRQAESRFFRVVEAFRDRLGRNIQEATGVTVSPVAWEAKRPELAAIPISLSQTFSMQWELLSWLLPMGLVGGFFRRHVLQRVPWEVEKNLYRLAGDWASTVDAAIADLEAQATTWVAAELATLERLLQQQPTEVAVLREALQRLEDAGLLQLR